MVVRLRIYNSFWVCPTPYPDECRFPENFEADILAKHPFRSYVKMADWLDEHKEYANRVMLVIPGAIKTLAGIKNVVFDGALVWVEGRGYV